MRLDIYFFLLMGCANAFAQTHSGHGEVPKAPNAPKTPIKLAPQKAEPAKKDEARVPIEVPLEQQSKIGLKVVRAEKKKVEHTIRTVGTVTADQTKEAHVHTKINGWVEQIYADYIGKPVKKGQSLFELYSPDLVSTQEEYLAARKQGAPGREIAVTALERLKLWGVPQSEIDRLKKSGKAKRSVTFDSPVDGFIVNKTAIQGMYITPEMELYHIADLSRIWIIVTLYEYDVAVISVGDEAEIQLPYDPDKSFKGKISYIYPEIELETRTAKARIELDNLDQKLKPGMFSNISLKKNLGEAIVIPDDAVIDTGARKIVFIKTGTSRFEPREIKAGPRIENTFAILSGLKEGEEIVTSAHFLIDAESKFQAALQKGSPTNSGHGGHGEK
ncbi:MAG: efflux RND transporter periplasmic adaptor subunit [Parachlamydiales bacterium]|nr:efflux RND transporter periplasmic adaptor subunit [Deltaproteobacteria bacterium]